MADKSVSTAVALAQGGHYLDAANELDKLSQEPPRSHAALFAYTYYRRALLRQCNPALFRQAVDDLEKALGFPGLPPLLRQLIQSRLTALKGRNTPEIRKLDEAITQRFQTSASDINLREEFLQRYGLHQPQRSHLISHVDAFSCVGVYRWRGDPYRNERWSQLIRQFKQGVEVLPVFFGRILAEHVQATHADWLKDIDYIVPVAADAQRTAERGADIVGQMAGHLGQRLAIPCRVNLLKREDNSAHSKNVGSRHSLAAQYSLDPRKGQYVEERVILLVDDVTTRGYTASVCAEKLKGVGASKVYVLTLAQAESSLQSERHSEARRR